MQLMMRDGGKAYFLNRIVTDLTKREVVVLGAQ